MEYNCRVCHFRQLYKNRGRSCFAFEVFDNGDRGQASGDLFDVPMFEVDGAPVPSQNPRYPYAKERRFLDGESFLEVLWETSERLPFLSTWQTLKRLFPEVCENAFFDEVMGSLISAQHTCSTYKLDITDPTVRKEVLGFYMSLEDMIEAFDIIVSARNAFERWEYEQVEQKNSQQGKK